MNKTVLALLLAALAVPAFAEHHEAAATHDGAKHEEDSAKHMGHDETAKEEGASHEDAHGAGHDVSGTVAH